MTAEEYRDELLGRSDREIIERAVALHGRGTEQEVAELLRLRQGVYKQRIADRNPIADANRAAGETVWPTTGFPSAS